jgi:hypothetical protein
MNFRCEYAETENIPINQTTRHRRSHDKKLITFSNAFFTILCSSLTQLLIECSYFRPNHTIRCIYEWVLVVLLNYCKYRLLQLNFVIFLYFFLATCFGLLDHHQAMCTTITKNHLTVQRIRRFLDFVDVLYLLCDILVFLFN